MTEIPRNENVNEYRNRLLDGMAASIKARGYAATTIADVVREAGVSRRTFYEHFDGRADCLIALHDGTSEAALRVLQGAIDPMHDWQVQVEQALAAYLGALACNPVLLRTLFLDLPGLGAPGLAARRRAHQAIADFMLKTVNDEHENMALSPDMAVAAVGGIHELVLQAIERDQVAALTELATSAARLVRAVVTKPA